MTITSNDKVSFTKSFDHHILQHSAAQMCEFLEQRYLSNRKHFDQDRMWLSRMDLLAFPVIYYLIEIRDTRKKIVTHKDFFNFLDMHKIAEALEKETISEDTKMRLEMYLKKIGYYHGQESGDDHHIVQNFCMSIALKDFFDGSNNLLPCCHEANLDRY